MCLILFAYHHQPGYRLVLAANRDEFYNRPTARAAFWDDRPDILAGRDLTAGGTWLGVTRTGRFAALTNYRDPARVKTNPQSRGQVVSEYLRGSMSPADYVSSLSAAGHHYNGFNLIAGDLSSLWYYSNITNRTHCLDSGLYGISNRFLDTPWPKVKNGKTEMARCLRAGHADAKTLFAVLSDETPACDKELPRTGVGQEWERI
ncbi:MAG: NRDE family protein, partial [Bacillota bacterium]|nr:NRDE family protein [Bacillota bacterium]